MFFSSTFSTSQVVLLPLLLSLAGYVSAQVCNGHTELCGRSYGNVTYVGAHNSYAVGVNSLAVNQDQDVTQQLNDGIRLLQLQAHNKSGVIELCHTSCSLLDGGTLEAYLVKVKTWMDANQNDVVTILIVNSDGFKPQDYDQAFQSAGLAAISYRPPSASIPATGWPILSDMLSSNQRLVTFLDTGADFTTVPYIINEFTNVWETAFDVTDPTFDCAVNRSNGIAATELYLINHFLDKIVVGQPVPDVTEANVTNSASGPGSLQAQVDTCIAANTVPPNFLLVDFYEFGGGSVFQVAANINGVQYSPQTPIASPKDTGGGSMETSVPLSAASTISPSLWGVALLAVIAGMTL
jgi:hypothetical protein